MTVEVSAIDGPALIAALRKNDQAAIDQAYRLVFASDLGRLVLAHHLADCGVGDTFGAIHTAGEVRYRAGQHDAALSLAAKAGFGQATLAVAVLTDQLQGTDDDDQPEPQDYATLADDEF